MQLGPFQIREVHAGRLALDGGVVFDGVPRPLWSRQLEPDAENRVTLAARCLLLETGRRRILVDTGPGARWDADHVARYGLDPAHDVVAGLAALGVSPEDVTDVVLSHLHWPHAGGIVTSRDGRPALTFPRAAHHVQRRAWKWAHTPSDRDAWCFRIEDLDVLEEAARVHFVEGEQELLEGLSLLPVDGHTVGQQLVRLTCDEGSVLYLADAIPTAAHVEVTWGMGDDLYPLTVIEEKKQILAQALEDRWTIVFAHEPRFAACNVREERGCTVVDERVAL